MNRLLSLLTPQRAYILLGMALVVLVASGISARIAYKYAYNAQQTKIDTIVNERQRERSEWNSRVASVSINAWRALQDAKNRQYQIFVTREQIITKWRTEYVPDPRCGLSHPAVRAVNQMLEVR